MKTNYFKGSYGTYPDRGYKIDFDSDRDLNEEKIEKLKAENWIDKDTRCLQILWNIKSAWSKTYYTFQAAMEIPNP